MNFYTIPVLVYVLPKQAQQTIKILKDKFIIAIDSFYYSLISLSIKQVIDKSSAWSPIDSSLFLIIADVVIQDLEGKVIIYTFDFEFPFYYRYVDGTILKVTYHSLSVRF